MPQTYDNDDCRLEMDAELATVRDDLAAEIKAHKRTARSLAWYRDRVNLLQREQRRMRDPERTLVCDIIANCGLLPDADGSRYGTHNKVMAASKPAILFNCLHCGKQHTTVEACNACEASH